MERTNGNYNHGNRNKQTGYGDRSRAGGMGQSRQGTRYNAEGGGEGKPRYNGGGGYNQNAGGYNRYNNNNRDDGQQRPRYGGDRN